MPFNWWIAERIHPRQLQKEQNSTQRTRAAGGFGDWWFDMNERAAVKDKSRFADASTQAANLKDQHDDAVYTIASAQSIICCQKQQTVFQAHLVENCGKQAKWLLQSEQWQRGKSWITACLRRQIGRVIAKNNFP